MGEFNDRVFSMVQADRATLNKFVRQHSRLRPGFHELLRYCREQGIEFAIVSNGLDFYIDIVLSDLGLKGIPYFAARTEFNGHGVKVRYIGPDGTEVRTGFKEAYTRLYQAKGYRIIYIGNGTSDIPAARLSSFIFAREQLLDHCQEAELKCLPFQDLHDVVKGLASSQG